MKMIQSVQQQIQKLIKWSDYLKHKIIFSIGLIMFLLGSLFLDKHESIIIIEILGAMIIGCSFMFKKDK